MATFVSAAAYAASKTLAAQGVAIPRSHLSEVIAALLGYGTLAALQAEGTPGHHPLDAAELFVLNEEAGRRRAADLCSPQQDPEAILSACVDGLRSAAAPRPVVLGVEGLVADHLGPEITESDELADVMAESNASYPDALEVGEGPTVSGDLWSSPTNWTISLTGKLGGEYDPEGDRMFNGDTIMVSAWVKYAKSGRAGLVKIDEAIVAGADQDGWRDEEL